MRGRLLKKMEEGAVVGVVVSPVQMGVQILDRYLARLRSQNRILPPQESLFHTEYRKRSSPFQVLISSFAVVETGFPQFRQNFALSGSGAWQEGQFSALLVLSSEYVVVNPGSCCRFNVLSGMINSSSSLNRVIGSTIVKDRISDEESGIIAHILLKVLIQRQLLRKIVPVSLS